MNLHKFNSISDSLALNQKLIAVSKGQDLRKIRQLYDVGQRDFGENFLQELKEKKDMLPDDIRWHFLGNIQSNKIKDIVKYSYLIHSIGRSKILDKIAKLESYKKIQVLLQLKLGEEETKSGFNETEIFQIVNIMKQNL